MDLLFELRRRVRHVIWPTLAVCALAYMTYHIINGDRGLLAWRAYKERIAEARVELAESMAERQKLEHRVRLLHPNRLDPDMVDEWARRLLSYGHPDDIVN